MYATLALNSKEHGNYLKELEMLEQLQSIFEESSALYWADQALRHKAECLMLLGRVEQATTAVQELTVCLRSLRKTTSSNDELQLLQLVYRRQIYCDDLNKYPELDSVIEEIRSMNI